MEERIRPRLTAAEGRKFGLTLAGAFLVFGAIAWWRHHPGRAEVLGGIGAAFGLAGLLVPTMLGPVERAWMGLAHLLSKVTTPIFMGIVYFVIFTPVGLIRRALGKNGLVHAPVAGSYWQTRAATRGASMERQF